MSTRVNRLASESSPYLRAHAQNPVNWHPWGPEAFARARAEDKPVFVSVGYMACHFCHRMERESFEDDRIAEFLNVHFICIKVDREQRPDLDRIYMDATVALSGSGGWPMSVFVTEAQEPFFAGTYFPPDDSSGRISFRALLERIVELWRDERAALLTQAEALSAHLKQSAPRGTVQEPNCELLLKGLRDELSSSYDRRFGGFGTAPKFPPSSLLGLLLSRSARGREPELREMVCTTLDGMKNGGLYDSLGGGFARYSTDARWQIPHFEKMLTDNAMLAQIYLEASLCTGNPEYRSIAGETLDFVLRELEQPGGGYATSLDADSEGVEGKYYLWSHEQLSELLPPKEALWFMVHHGIALDLPEDRGQVLFVSRGLAETAQMLEVPEDTLCSSLERSRRVLVAVRERRPRPLVDDQLITAYNGLMIGAMAEGARVLAEPRYLASARAAAEVVTAARLGPDGGLFRVIRQGHASQPGFLDDYAYLADGLLTLFEASGELSMLERARQLVERMLIDFEDPESGGLFSIGRDHDTVLFRPREQHDGALPNANAVAARALLRLGRHLERSDYVFCARRLLGALGDGMARFPRAAATALEVWCRLTEPPLEIVLLGHPGTSDFEALRSELGRHYLPNRVLCPLDVAKGDRHPLAKGRGMLDGCATVYLCQDSVCELPITGVEQLRERLRTR